MSDDTTSDDTTSDDAPPDKERLEALQHDIDQTRKDAEDADILVDPDKPRYADSGEEGDELDDQAITPPA